MSFVTALLMARNPQHRMVRMPAAIETSMVGESLLFNILDEPLTLTEMPDAKALADRPGEVRFQDVSFAYHAEQPVLSTNIDLTFSAGQTTSLLGPPGGGKSTLIMRLCDPTQSAVLMDGAKLTEATFAALREKTLLSGKTPFCFREPSCTISGFAVLTPTRRRSSQPPGPPMRMISSIRRRGAIRPRLVKTATVFREASGSVWR